MLRVWTTCRWHAVCALLVIFCTDLNCTALSLFGTKHRNIANRCPRFHPTHVGSTSAAHESPAVDTKSANVIATSHTGDGYQGARHFKPKRQKIKYKADYYRRTTGSVTGDGVPHQDSVDGNPTPQLQDQPSNVYLNLEYNYLSANSLFTIKHPWKYGKQGSSVAARDRSHTGVNPSQEESAGLADDMLHSWWASAKKWGLLTGALADLETRLQRGDDQVPPPSTHAMVTTAMGGSSYDAIAVASSTETTTLQPSAPTAPTPSAEKSPWPFLKMNKALTMRIEQLQSELGIDTATLQREVELLAQCNPSEEAIHQFGVKLLKIQSEKDNSRGRKRSAQPSSGGKGFGNKRHKESTAVGRKGAQDVSQTQQTQQSVASPSTDAAPRDGVTAAPTEGATAGPSSRGDEPAHTALSRSPLEALRELCRSHQARVICIGDVHGCVEEVCDLLRKAEFLPGDQVVFLGDLVVKGPNSVDVVQLAMDIGALSVRGNHDHAVVKERTLYVQALREMQAEIAASSSGSVENTSVRRDKPMGGKDDSNATPDASSEANAVSRKYAKFLENPTHTSAISKMPQHLRVAAALTEEQASWLADLPYFIRSLDLGAVFVHAGLLNNVRLPYQEPWIMMTMRSQMPSGRASSRCLSAHPWAKTWKGPLTAYFGHDTARGLQIYPSAYGIDTGCVYGGNLTAVLLPDQTIVSVPARQAYLKFK